MKDCCNPVFLKGMRKQCWPPDEKSSHFWSWGKLGETAYEWIVHSHIQMNNKEKDLEPILPYPLWIRQQKNWTNRMLLWGILFYWCFLKNLGLFVFNSSVSTFLFSKAASLEQVLSLFSNWLLSFLPQASLNTAANTPQIRHWKSSPLLNCKHFPL